LGADFTPQAIPGFNITLTYFNIDFKDRITSPSNPLIPLIEEDIFSSIIMRDPDPALVDALCNDPTFSGDPAICTFIPIGAIVDLRLNNTAVTKLEGLDFTLNYGLEMANSGHIDFRINGSYLFKFKESFSSVAPVIELVDTVNNPVDFTLRSSVTWKNKDGFSATTFINYTDSYRDDESDPDQRIDSWITFDLTLSYDTQDNFVGAGLNETTFTLSVINLFDNDPPFVNNLLGVAYDPANSNPLGRFISFNIVKKW
jgi:outer membrane receptor protein involved in Fe transport